MNFLASTGETIAVNLFARIDGPVICGVISMSSSITEIVVYNNPKRIADPD